MPDHNHLSTQELLMAIDGELPPPRQEAADTHLSHCATCRSRRTAIVETSDTFTAFHTATASPPAEDAWPARSRLRSSLREVANERARSNRGRAWSGVLLPSRWAMAGAALFAAVLLIRIAFPVPPSGSRATDAQADSDSLPNASLTPGATLNLSAGELCSQGAPEPRPIPEAVRRKVERDYGIQDVPRDEYELDYLITPELGGAPDARNLWPQRYRSRLWNAHVKDQLEDLLPQLVCRRQVSLEAAQRDIARDWILAYKQYFHTDVPLRVQADRRTDAKPPILLTSLRF